MINSNPWNSYRQVAAQTASPGQLILMLFDGAVRFLERALAGFTCEDLVDKHHAINNNIHRAQQIISELNTSLNVDEGGELAATLRRLYDYFNWRLSQSNLHKESTGIQEVIRHLTELRDAWAQMLLQNSQLAASAASAPICALS